MELTLNQIKKDLEYKHQNSLDHYIIMKVYVASLVNKTKIIENQEEDKFHTSKNCNFHEKFTDILKIRSQFLELIKVSVKTVSLCQNLNPLDTQEIDNCILDKIIDLKEQIIFISIELRKIIQKILKQSSVCVSRIL